MYALADHDAQTSGQPQIYTLSEVAKHAKQADCWMAIEGKVYDLTAYLSRHPAGPGTMVSWCGAEATEGMRSKGIGSDHSAYAWKQLEEYLIGTLQ